MLGVCVLVQTVGVKLGEQQPAQSHHQTCTTWLGFLKFSLRLYLILIHQFTILSLVISQYFLNNVDKMLGSAGGIVHTIR